MVRRTGMKIMDKGNINGLIPFAGVLYIEGGKLNEYLRTLENPQHTKWEIERAENKSEAKGVLSALTKFIKACLDELKMMIAKKRLTLLLESISPLSKIQHNRDPKIRAKTSTMPYK